MNLLSIAQAAELLGITPDAVYRAIRRGKLHAQQVGTLNVIERDEVERYKKSRRKQNRRS